MDALARVGDEIVREVGGSDSKDSRKDKKLPRQLAALVALRAQGFDNKEIADKLGVSVQKVRALIKKARVEYGWSDLGEKLAHYAIPDAIDNVIKHLEHEGSASGIALGRSTMTRATLAGLGMFKTHSAVKQESKSEQTNILRVEIVLPELPPGVQGLLVADGSVMATPRRALSAVATPASAATPLTIDAEVVNR